MEMKFHGLTFKLINNHIYLTEMLGFNNYEEDLIDLYNFIEVQVAGENHNCHCGAKQLNCSETPKLKYISFSHKENHLEVVTKSDLLSITTHFVAYDNSNVIRTYSVINNNTDDDLIIENMSSLRFFGLGNNTDNLKDIYLYKFFNSWHVECQVMKESLHDLCLYNGNKQSMKRVFVYNTGSWSTKEYLPQAIIEDVNKNMMFFFQIESSTSWSYEIGDFNKHLYLNASGPNMTDNNCSYLLKKGGEIVTKAVAFCVGKDINEVVGEMTKYRRNISISNYKDNSCPIIFNEYMHLSWDNPNEQKTKQIANKINDFDIDYYVIDCGWHDECDPDDIYSNCGTWEESNKRFPSGIRQISSYINQNGMNLGLWIEPEIIGYKNNKMIEYYGDAAFFKRNGKTIITSNRIFLDYRNPKVVDYIEKTIDKMVNEYGAKYIKIDYNQDCGYGTETDATTLGEGLLLHSEAYLNFIKKIHQKYPDVLFEACASGGCRLDYETLSNFSICSTSDQTNYKKYPYIASNILSAVLPEQAGVWSYPVESIGNYNDFVEETDEMVNKRIDDEQVIMNMINTFLGRMHLSSAIHKLDDNKKKLIKDGISYYRKITKDRINGLPIFPLGFSHFGDTHVASGIINKKVIYLSAYNLGGDKKFTIDFPNYVINSAKIDYPFDCNTKISNTEHSITINFDKDYQARFVKITISN